jgi:hypothetical protein
MNAPRLRERLGVLALAVAAARCGESASPTTPSQPPLPVVAESVSFRYHYDTGDRVDADWQETYHAWATARLGVSLPQKIEYYKYQSRQAMGDRTGNYNTNAFAEPSRFEIHTLWSTDNHEVVHVYTALVGRPSDFFNEGIAVAFQTNPAAGDFDSVFNGQQVHSACSQYLQAGALVVPLARVVSTTDFRAVSDQVLSYREAGSFVRFTIDRYGIERVLQFFRVSSRTDSLAAIQERFQSAFGVSMESAESEWTAMLRNQGVPRLSLLGLRGLT